MRRPLRALLALLPVAIATGFVWIFRVEVAEAMGEAGRLLPWFALALALFLLWTVVAAFGWRRLLAATSPSGHAPSLGRCTVLRIEAQAVNHVVPLAGLGGEALKATLAARTRDEVAGAATATVLDNVAGAVAGFAFAALWLGVVMLSQAAEVPGSPILWSVIGLAVAAGVAQLPFLIAPPVMRRAREGSAVHRVFRPLADNARGVRAAFRVSTVSHLLERFLAAGEIYVVLVALAPAASYADAALVYAVVIGVSFAFFFIPGQIGAADAGVVAACTALGLPPAIGVTVTLFRRARQVVVIIVGALLIALVERRSPFSAPAVGQVALQEQE